MLVSMPFSILALLERYYVLVVPIHESIAWASDLSLHVREGKADTAFILRRRNHSGAQLAIHLRVRQSFCSTLPTQRQLLRIWDV